MIDQIKATYLSVFGRAPAADFSDATLLQYADYYSGDPDQAIIRMVMQTCAGRLALRTFGTPSDDDPIGKDQLEGGGE
jgi:hypothetical protein